MQTVSPPGGCPCFHDLPELFRSIRQPFYLAAEMGLSLLLARRCVGLSIAASTLPDLRTHVSSYLLPFNRGDDCSRWAGNMMDLSLAMLLLLRYYDVLPPCAVPA
ncbi:hypothetical protein PF001_g26606 [Phytophthora fragariae]|uniref:Uncharacterized protein n=1 Tax=Phytophthora fragariae TaxID=53985 RepID=A0A6A4BQZ9_9STRA|nr:hypothetical protein PF001_g26606 [Phytophthora fragariae]